MAAKLTKIMDGILLSAFNLLGATVVLALGFAGLS